MPRKYFTSLSERHKRRLVQKQLIAHQLQITNHQMVACEIPLTDKAPTLDELHDSLEISNNNGTHMVEIIESESAHHNNDQGCHHGSEIKNNDSYSSVNNEQGDVPVEQLVANSSPSLQNTHINPEKVDLVGDLRCFVVNNNVSQKVVNDLLTLLLKHFPSAKLPKDSRTLMRTPLSIASGIKTINGGKFVYFGMQEGIIKCLKKNFAILPNCVKLNLNIDGLPLAKNTTSQFWPIMGLILTDFYIDPFIIAMHHGLKKPDCANKFLKPLVDEALDLMKSGIVIDCTVIKFEINAIVCDAPARAFVTGTKGHTGYFGCGKCNQEGEYLEHRVVFPETNCTNRSDDSFRLRQQPEHHIRTSILEDINIGMVTQIPNDYLHLVCLGVQKKLLIFWLRGKKLIRLNAVAVETVSQKLIETRPCIPGEFCRKPRSILEIDRWKGTELRQFLLYTGPVVLKGILTSTKYAHFMSLSIAIRIMCSVGVSSELLDFAHSLLVWFVNNYAILYGEEHISFNVHNLIHLLTDVKRFGPLDNFSSFPFENFMQKIKKKVKISGKPLEQLINRIVEEQQILISPPLTKKYPSIHYSKIHVDVAKEIKFKSFGITCSIPNNICLLKDKSYATVVGICVQGLKINFQVRRFLEVTPFFLSPCNSILLGIVLVSDKKSPVCKISSSDIEAKCMALKDDETHLVLLPMLQNHKH